ncbi:MAG: ABC transporter ATP-binding protein [Anaerolineae bacterium]|jgi:ABC-type lipoprotein export system ATPase subunit
MKNNGSIVETRDLVKVYGDGSQVRALDGVNMQIAQGAFVSVMGPSGSGKSTLLNMVGALDRPTEGTVMVGGEDLLKVRNLDTFRARQVGFIFQLHNLIPTLNARENVEVPMMGQPIGRGKRKKRAKELLEMVGLGDRLNHLPNQLSGGQRQRVAIARALANKPAIVLADEPTGDLDSESGAEVINLMKQLNEELDTTFIVVTHDPAVSRETERVLIMRDGRIAHEHEVGTPFEEDLAAFRRSALGQQIIGGDADVLDEFGPDEREALRRLLENSRR